VETQVEDAGRGGEGEEERARTAEVKRNVNGR
jgi:hypothetical protein